MEITALTRAVKNPNNVNVFLDNRYWVSIHEQLILDLGIHKGLVVSTEFKESVEQNAKQQKIVEKVRNYMMIRPRSIQELQQYLKFKKEIKEQQVIDQILNELKVEDDFEFAKWFIDNRRHSGKYGKLKVEAELRAKGVSPATINRVFLLEPWTQDNTQLLAKAKVGLNEKDPIKYKQKLMQRLLRKGVSYDEIKKILTEFK